ncbi:MAG: carotenoid 1,2-hydratase [Mitsuaria chitosanitabida]|uniref:lipocalin-like domain-containing protein n=1 Tax=Roseateles chitosanitabidus TaxID=65048 RepID=UPI001B2B7E80|nr:carotenoid 1,2-hydratase [Roseateles chitosanitabidus]MBO9685724.1 carotenoid 1,2-hydratase [Roseateles chitosanitabidus]
MIGRRPLLKGLGAWSASTGLGALGAPVGLTGLGTVGGIGAGLALSPDMAGAQTLSDAPLRFPRDHGAHPETRIEWWYLTGVLRAPSETAEAARSNAATPLPPPTHGFQLTFFRLRNDLARPLDSAFAPGQLMLAHAAISDLGRQRLLHDQRVLRHGFANARTELGDTAVRLGDWQLRRSDAGEGRSRYDLVMHSEVAGFALSLSLRAPLPPLLQGREGWSRKGPGPEQASRYVSEPQLAGTGRLALRDGGTREVAARAWLDHEWSNDLLGRGAGDDTMRRPASKPVGGLPATSGASTGSGLSAGTGPSAASGTAAAAAHAGWDWLGLNLDDGSALTLFQVRGDDGTAAWTGGSWRGADGRQADFEQQLRFEPLAHWRSPVSLATYPVRWRVRTPRGVILVEAAFQAQEIDARRSTGFPYWEGAARVSDEAGRPLGWGYLEMTGYAGRVPL